MFCWSREAVMALIDVYQKRSCLWNTKSSAYHNREKNRDALEEMVKIVSMYHANVTAEDCKKKYQGLRAQFSREHAKYMASFKSGSSTEELYEPKLWYYEDLMFLQDSIQHKKGRFFGLESEEDEMVVEYLEEDEEVVIKENPRQSRKRLEIAHSPEPGPSVPKKTQGSRKQESSEQDPLQCMLGKYFQTKAQKKEKDRFEKFGEFIGNRLKLMKKKYQKKAEKEILKIIINYMPSDSESETE